MNLPNKLSLLRIFLIPIFVVCFYLPFNYCKFIALGIFVLASITDALDGHIARKHNMVTNLGIFLDPIADKMLVACALLVIMGDSHSFTILVSICTMIIICRELLVSVFRIVATSKGVNLAADKIGKIKTILQMVALMVLIPYENIFVLNTFIASIVLYVGLSLLVLSTLLALISVFNYIIKNKQVLKEE